MNALESQRTGGGAAPGWVCAVVVVAAVAASWFVPEYGWRDVLSRKEQTFDRQVDAARQRLDALKALDASEADAADKTAAATRLRLEEKRSEFAKLGFAPLPEGDGAVFVASSEVDERLAKRNLRIVSRAATAKPVAQTAPAATAATSARAAKGKQQITAAEFRRESEQAAAKIKDKNVREMFVAENRRKLAQLEAAERDAAKKPQQPAVAQAVPANASGAGSFARTDVRYTAAGRFQDAFMFFVDETARRPAYAFRDISFANSADGSPSLSFVLEVHGK